MMAACPLKVAVAADTPDPLVACRMDAAAAATPAALVTSAVGEMLAPVAGEEAAEVTAILPTAEEIFEDTKEYQRTCLQQQQTKEEQEIEKEEGVEKEKEEKKDKEEEIEEEEEEEEEEKEIEEAKKEEEEEGKEKQQEEQKQHPEIQQWQQGCNGPSSTDVDELQAILPAKAGTGAEPTSLPSPVATPQPSVIGVGCQTQPAEPPPKPQPRPSVVGVGCQTQPAEPSPAPQSRPSVIGVGCQTQTQAAEPLPVPQLSPSVVSVGCQTQLAEPLRVPQPQRVPLTMQRPQAGTPLLHIGRPSPTASVPAAAFPSLVNTVPPPASESTMSFTNVSGQFLTQRMVTTACFGVAVFPGCPSLYKDACRPDDMFAELPSSPDR